MNTKQAILRFSCEQCREGDDCGRECELDGSCSFHCPNCSARNWFAGDLQDSPKTVKCCGCGILFSNKYAMEA